MPPDVDRTLGELIDRLVEVGLVSDVWVGGSLATGDYVPTVSDLDLVAVTSRPLLGQARSRVVALHQMLDAGVARGMNLGCQYAAHDQLHDLDRPHPTWTHGGLVDRPISRITRAELVRHGFPVLARPPLALLPPVTGDDIRAAAQVELTGYWSYAARRPGMFLQLPVMVDLGLTAMARGRHALTTGELLTKSAAIDHARAPQWLTDQLQARRRGEKVSSPRVRAGYLAWRDVHRACRQARSC